METKTKVRLSGGREIRLLAQKKKTVSENSRLSREKDLIAKSGKIEGSRYRCVAIS